MHLLECMKIAYDRKKKLKVVPEQVYASDEKLMSEECLEEKEERELKERLKNFNDIQTIICKLFQCKQGAMVITTLRSYALILNKKQNTLGELHSTEIL